MKKYLSILTVSAALLFVSSCNLDKYPYDDLEQTQALKSIEDARNFEIGAYARFKAVFRMDNIIAGDLQADYANAVSGFTNTYGPLHRWSLTQADYQTTYTWDYAYLAIAQFNFIIDNVPGIAFNDAQEQAEADMIVGEAYLMRAITAHMLALKFCDSYTNGNVAAEHSGLPKVDKYEPTDMPERASLESTYTQILSDIGEAKSRMAGLTGAANSTYLTEDCVTALEAQVLLSMGNYTEALRVANTLIGSSKYSLAKTQEAVTDMWTYDQGPEVIFVFAASRTNLPSQFGYYFIADRNSADDDFLPDYIPTQATVDMYDDGDFRKEAYFLKTEGGDCEIGGTFISTPVYLLNKYPGNPNLKTSTIAKNYYNAFKLFRLSEMYLIAAEAAVQSGGDAKTPLNALRQARGLEELGSVTLADVKAERFREMIFEGNRISDLRRWGDPCVRGAVQTGKNAAGEDFGLVSLGDEFDKLNVQAGDFRMVWPIPETAIYANQKLKDQQNPGWDRF